MLPALSVCLHEARHAGIEKRKSRIPLQGGRYGALDEINILGERARRLNIGLYSA